MLVTCTSDAYTSKINCLAFCIVADFILLNLKVNFNFFMMELKKKKLMMFYAFYYAKFSHNFSESRLKFN